MPLTILLLMNSYINQLPHKWEINDQNLRFYDICSHEVLVSCKEFNAESMWGKMKPPCREPSLCWTCEMKHKGSGDLPVPVNPMKVTLARKILHSVKELMIRLVTNSGAGYLWTKWTRATKCCTLIYPRTQWIIWCIHYKMIVHSNLCQRLII